MAFVLIGVRMTLIKQVEGHTLTKTPPKKTKQTRHRTGKASCCKLFHGSADPRSMISVIKCLIFFYTSFCANRLVHPDKATAVMIFGRDFRPDF